MPRRTTGPGPGPIWKRIQSILEEKGWSHHDLHRATKIARSTISRWSNGHDTPGRASLEKIAGALRVALDDLVNPRPLPQIIPIGKRERLSDKERTVIEAYRHDEEVKKEIHSVLERVARLRARLRGEYAEVAAEKPSDYDRGPGGKR